MMSLQSIRSSHFYLFLTFLSVAVINRNCMASTQQECPFVSEGPKMCAGSPYSEEINSTPVFCKMYRCETDPSCAGFTFYVTENKCALFENCDTTTLVDCTDEYACITGVCNDAESIDVPLIGAINI